MNNMNKLIFLLLVLFVVACKQTVKPEIDNSINDNEELSELYKADQADRNGNIDWSVVSERDNQRQERVIEMLKLEMVHTSDDYANAAMIFQHGGDTIASGMAVKLMRKAVELDPDRRKWLLAAAIDRDLMRRGEPQIYGTQYRRMGAGTPWVIYTLDTTKITDEERKEFGVETLAEQKERLKMMNKLKLITLLEAGHSIDDIIKLIGNSDLQDAEYDLSESGINRFGYQLIDEGKVEEALKFFKLNTQLYPTGFNTFDSYGECLVKLGRIEEGIEAYKKSLELNPKSESAKKVLSEIEDK